MFRPIARLQALALGLAATSCSLVAPLDDKYSFGELCEELPTQAEACEGRCGDVIACEEPYVCGACGGELACEAERSVCECSSPPCAVASLDAGDTGNERIVDVAVDVDGNVFVAGHFRGVLELGGETHENEGGTWDDVFVVKIDPEGEVLWSRAFGDVDGNDSTQTVSAIDVDPLGNLVLLGYSYEDLDLGEASLACDGDIVLLKLDGDGEHVFSDCFGTQYSVEAVDVAIDPATHDIYVTGNFWGTMTVGSTSITASGDQSYYDIFVARFAPDGTPRSAKKFGDGSEQIPESLSFGGGYLYATARFNGAFDFGPPNATTVETTEWYAGVLTRLTPHVSHSWSLLLGHDIWETNASADLAGNVFVAGYFGGTLEFAELDSADGSEFLAKVDPEGALVWARQFANVDIRAVDAGEDGSVTVAGLVSDTHEVDLGGGPLPVSFTSDPFLARYDAEGDYVFGRVFSAPIGSQRMDAVAVTGSGEAWGGVTFDGELDLGLGAMITRGGTDFAAVRYAP